MREWSAVGDFGDCWSFVRHSLTDSFYRDLDWALRGGPLCTFP